MGSIGVNKVVNDLFQKYDHNMDGKLQLTPQAYVEVVENERKTLVKLHDESSVSGSGFASKSSTDSVSVTVKRDIHAKRVMLDERVRPNANYRADQIREGSNVATMQGLFHAADANKDKELTREELVTFVKENYDTNKDGILQAKFWGKSEKERFKSDFSERHLYYSDFQ